MLALLKRPNSADFTFRQPSQSLDQVGENSEMAALERDLLIWEEEKALAQKAHEARTRLETDGTRSLQELETARQEETAAKEELEAVTTELIDKLREMNLLDLLPELVGISHISTSYTDEVGGIPRGRHQAQ